MNKERKEGTILGGALLAMALSLGVGNFEAQERPQGRRQSCSGVP